MLNLNDLNKKALLIVIIILLVVLFLEALFLFNTITTKNENSLESDLPASSPQDINNKPEATVIKKVLQTNKDYSIEINNSYNFQDNGKLPKFIKFSNNKIIVTANKYSEGNYNLNFIDSQNKKVDYEISLIPKQLDLKPLEAQIIAILGDKYDQYSIHFKDLLSEQTLDINKGKIVEPASIAKLPVAVLVMRDIDAGKYTLDTTYPMKNSEKFSFIGNLGSLPDGTPVTIRSYLENLLEHSDNNAWYALVHFLGNSYEVVNPRIINELGVNPLFLDPPEGTAKAVGKILEDLYDAKTTTKESAEYLIGLMEKADDWARQGVGLGLPVGTTFANKIGTLKTDDKVSYQGGAIVWSQKTDYVLVVMDENIEWDEGANTIKNISEAIYNYINK